jgi:hypothetical protein
MTKLKLLSKSKAMSYRTGAMTRGIASAIAMATTATINWML